MSRICLIDFLFVATMMKSQRLLSYDALVIVVFSERESIGENRENKIERDTIEQLRGIWWTISDGG